MQWLDRWKLHGVVRLISMMLYGGFMQQSENILMISALAIGWKGIIGIMKAVVDIFVKLRAATKILWALFLRHPFAVVATAMTGVILGFQKIYSWILKTRNVVYKNIGTTEGLLSSYYELWGRIRELNASIEDHGKKFRKITELLKSNTVWAQFLNKLENKRVKTYSDLNKVIATLDRAIKGQEKIAERRRKALEKMPKIPDIPPPKIKEPDKTPYQLAIEDYERAVASLRAMRKTTIEEEYKLFRLLVEGQAQTAEEINDYIMRIYRFEQSIREKRKRDRNQELQDIYNSLLEEARIREKHLLHIQTFAEAYYQWRQQQEESIFKIMQDYCLEIEKTVHSVFIRVIEGAMTLRSAFQEIGRAIRRMIIEQIATELMKAMKISKAISKVVGFITTAIRGFFFGAPIPIPTMQKGGIVTKPTLALLGEREREAVIPLSRIHEFIPKMNITVNIHNPTIAERMDIETIVSQITEGIKRAQPRMIHLAEVIRG